MNLLDIQTQIEEELTWRQNEIRFLRNQLIHIEDPDEQKIYRKSLVVMLYSHFEGFCKTAFLIYINAINNERILRENANFYIRTLSMAKVFQLYHNTDKKCEIFKDSLPSDEKLHSYARRVEMVTEFNNFLSKIVEIPEDVVDIESNLKPKVLRKILYMLGFAHDIFSRYEGKIEKLLEFRNKVAHGVLKAGIESTAYEAIEREVFSVMNELKGVLMGSLAGGKYLRETS